MGGRTGPKGGIAVLSHTTLQRESRPLYDGPQRVAAKLWPGGISRDERLVLFARTGGSHPCWGEMRGGRRGAEIRATRLGLQRLTLSGGAAFSSPCCAVTVRGSGRPVGLSPESAMRRQHRQTRSPGGKASTFNPRPSSATCPRGVALAEDVSQWRCSDRPARGPLRWHGVRRLLCRVAAVVVAWVGEFDKFFDDSVSGRNSEGTTPPLWGGDLDGQEPGRPA